MDGGTRHEGILNPNELNNSAWSRFRFMPYYSEVPGPIESGRLEANVSGMLCEQNYAFQYGPLHKIIEG